MKNDTLIRIEGMDALMEKLGLVEAERFIGLIQREPFDYTRWREGQFNDKDVATIFKEAAARRARRDGSEKVKVVSTATKAKAPKKPSGRRKTAKRLAHA